MIGRREYLDARGRTAKVVYYQRDWESMRGGSLSPVSAEGSPASQPTSDVARLRLHSFETYDYDAAGRRVRSSRYLPDGTLASFATYSYFDDGWLRSTRNFTPSGRMHYEIRYAAPTPEGRADQRRWGGPLRGREESHLYYDEKGERIDAIRGRVPNDFATKGDWGDARDDLRCAIVGQQDAWPELRFVVLLQNTGTTARGAVLSPGAFRSILRDDARNVIPVAEGSPGAKYLRVDTEFVTESPIEPGKTARCFDLALLKNNYAPLPPGDYTLQVEYRGRGTEWVLSSRELCFTVR